MSGAPRPRERVISALARSGLAAVGLAGAEIALASLSRAENVGAAELLWLVSAAFGVAALASLMVTTSLAAIRALARSRSDDQSARRLIGIATFVVVAPMSGLVLWLLTSGRRVHDLPGRPLVVVAVAEIGRASCRERVLQVV